MTCLARVIEHEAGQLIRLPEHIRLETEELCVTQMGSALVLMPSDDAWELFRESLGQADDDFLRERDQPLDAEQRPEL